MILHRSFFQFLKFFLSSIINISYKSIIHINYSEITKNREIHAHLVSMQNRFYLLYLFHYG